MVVSSVSARARHRWSATIANDTACYNFAARMRLARTLIGMVHLTPLPGSPRWDGSMERATVAAVADATVLIEGGMDALLVENYGDAPFTPGRVEPSTVASMAVIVSGKVTGDATSIGDVKRVRSAVPTVPILVGSGVTADSVAELLSVAEGVIVGTFVKRDGSVRQPVDPERVRRLCAAARG